jgi:hypothetical protein
LSLALAYSFDTPPEPKVIAAKAKKLLEITDPMELSRIYHLAVGAA